MTAVAREIIEDDVFAGLRARPKRLPCRLLYDAAGAQLFEQIGGLDEYYPRREELRLLDAHLPQIARIVGPGARVIEPGSGACIKTRRLLRALDAPASFVAIDVSAEQLARAAALLRHEHSTLEIMPITADFTRPFALPPSRCRGRTVVFFPGSTIGNFEPSEAIAFLSRLRHHAGPGGLLLLGADGTRDRDTLLRAYDDEQGVTAAFDKNVLAHLNRTRHATFDLDEFVHRAVWNEARSRVEMHLVARSAQCVEVDGLRFEIAAGESIVTEHCYKHHLHAMRTILVEAGWQVREVMTSRVHAMRLWLCEAGTGRALLPRS